MLIGMSTWHRELLCRMPDTCEPGGSSKCMTGFCGCICRYIVIPERPAGTEGWSEEELAKLVTRDSMIGVEPAKAPETAAKKARTKA